MSELIPNIPEDIPQPGEVYAHCMGGTYTFLGIQHDATGYETTGEVTQLARYRQDHDGSFPAGTIWTRNLEEFMHGTAEINGQKVPIFQRQQ